MNLLDKAKQLDKKRGSLNNHVIDEQTIELAMAWARGEVSTATCNKVLGYKSGGVQIYVTLARALKAHMSKNI